MMQDKLLRKKYSESAFDKIKEYDWINIGKKYLELYQSVLSK